jgi:hypothetical protein
MQLFRSMRWLVLALLVSFVPLSSHAGVFISVGFAPPALPIYEQPPCPQPGLMWTPGYWAYGPDGYFWVPGAWVPAPYEGALWTPGYWGWSGGLFVFHEGYWGPHVGYYGGVNYGFGYGGIGFAGGEWRGGVFAYNTAVVRVDERYVHTTFVDRARVDRGFVARDNHVAFSGGPGGINHPPSANERVAERESHVAPTRFQAQHMQSAQSDRTSYAKANAGRPRNLAVAKPLAVENHPAPSGAGAGRGGAVNNSPRPNTGNATDHPSNFSRPSTGNPGASATNSPRSTTGSAGARPYNSPRSNAGNSAAPRAPQSRPAPQTQSHPAPKAQSRPAPAPKEEH